MSLKSKIEAVIYASEEPVTLQQLTSALAEEAQADLDRIAAQQPELPLDAPVHETLHESAYTTSDLNVAAPADEDLTADASADAQALELTEAVKRQLRDRDRAVREYIRGTVAELIRDYAAGDRGIEIRDVAGGFRMGTKPEYHDTVRGFVKSLKPALKLSLQALETLAVVAYKQPVTAAEISEIRGVDSAGVLGGLMTRKLIATAGRKQVIGRPMLYKTTKEFLLRFGLRDVQELPSMDEFERMAGELTEPEDLLIDSTEALIEHANERGDAEHLRDVNSGKVIQPETLAAPQDLSETGEPDDLDVEKPSEDLVTDVLGVSPENCTGTGTSPAPAGMQSNTESEINTSGAETYTSEAQADAETTDPIEAVAAIQAEQTGALINDPATPDSGKPESEPQ